MPFTEDLTAFFSTSDFGTAATYNGSTTINGIFDNDYTEPMGRLQAASPVFVCRTADVSTAAHGQTLVINAVTYKIRGVEPDGTGITLLRLEKQ